MKIFINERKQTILEILEIKFKFINNEIMKTKEAV